MKRETIIQALATVAFFVLMALGSWNLKVTSENQTSLATIMERLQSQQRETERIASVQVRVLDTLSDLQKSDACLDKRVTILETTRRGQ